MFHLLAYFDFATCKQGLEYWRKGNVIDAGAVVHPRTGKLELHGRVWGKSSTPYLAETTVSADRNAIESARCSCPARSNCKHCVALLKDWLESLGSRDTAGCQPGLAASRSASVAGTAAGAKTREAGAQLAVTIMPSPNCNDLVDGSADTATRVTLRQLGLADPPPDLRIQFSAIAELHKSAERTLCPDGLVSGDGKAAVRACVIYILSDKSASCNPCIEALGVNIKKDGALGAARKLDVNRITLTDYATPKCVAPSDLNIFNSWQLAVSDGESQRRYSYAYSYYHLLQRHDYENFRDAESFHSLLGQMVETGRCHFESTDNTALSLGPNMDGRLSWISDKGLYRVEVVTDQDNTRRRCLRWKFPYYLDSENATIGRVILPVSSAVLAKLLSMRPIKKSELPSISLLLAEAGLNDIVPVPPGCKPVIFRRGAGTPELFINSKVCRQPVMVAADRMVLPGETMRVAELVLQKTKRETAVHIEESGAVVVEEYDETRVNEHIEQLRQLGFRRVTADHFEQTALTSHFFVAPPETWSLLNDSTIADLRKANWKISPETEKKTKTIDLSESDLEFAAEDTGNSFWFSLALNITVNGRKVPLLPVLISAIRRLPRGKSLAGAADTLNANGKFVCELADGQLISLPFDRVKAILLALQELLNTDHAGERLSISLLHAADLLGSGYLSNALWTGAERIKGLVERLRQLTCIAPASAPPRFKASLRKYQEDGLGWLQFLAEQGFGGILADDMGLGKTIQLLAHICKEKQEKRLAQPFLVVCPTSVLPNWVSETAKFAPHLKFTAHSGSGRFSVSERLTKSDLVITTYALLTRDVDLLKKIHWHGIALDEAQAIKNPSAQVASAARSLKANYRFCLTGTPIENHLGELWSQFQFLLPGLLGDHASFNRQVRAPIEKGGDKSLKAALAGRVRPFILRRTKQQVLAELPEKTVIVQPIELDAAQRDLYETVRIASTDQIREEVAKKGFKHSQIMILDALLKLRQVCCDARLVKLSSARQVQTSAKLDQLLHMLTELAEEGRKILVFSQFTSMLDLIAAELEKLKMPYVELRGDTRDRLSPVQQFQEGDVQIFLLSLKAGGTGLNLTAADVVIHYDPWWNPAVEDQATDRAHRIGQSKKVFVYKLIAQGTIEQRMIELQERKRMLANCIYDQHGGLSQSFSEADLEALLKPIGTC